MPNNTSKTAPLTNQSIANTTGLLPADVQQIGAAIAHASMNELQQLCTVIKRIMKDLKTTSIARAIASYQETQAPTPNAPADEVPQQTVRADTHTIGADLTASQTMESLLQNLARSQSNGLLFEVQSRLAFQSGRELLPQLLSGALEPRNNQELALLNALRAALPVEEQMSSFLSWENCLGGENACQQLVFSQVEIPPEYFQELASAPTQLAIAPAASVPQLQESPELQQPPLNVT